MFRFLPILSLSSLQALKHRFWSILIAYITLILHSIPVLALSRRPQLANGKLGYFVDINIVVRSIIVLIGNISVFWALIDLFAQICILLISLKSLVRIWRTGRFLASMSIWPHVGHIDILISRGLNRAHTYLIYIVIFIHD